jgi:hypothetical protein
MADTQTRAAVMATRRQNGGLPTMAQGHGAYKLKDDETHADQNEELTPAEIERYTIGKVMAAIVASDPCPGPIRVEGRGWPDVPTKTGRRIAHTDS